MDDFWQEMGDAFRSSPEGDFFADIFTWAAANPGEAIGTIFAMIAAPFVAFVFLRKHFFPKPIEFSDEPLSGGDRNTALDAGGRDAAEIEAEREPAGPRMASVAFAEGQIAEEEVRWHDAARSYAEAARLEPTFDHLDAARRLAGRIGDRKRATELGHEMVAVAKSQFSENAAEVAQALNNSALSLADQGRLEEAEPIYRQALEICRATIGERHENYAVGLNNLAQLLVELGRLDEAEPLHRQAIEIEEETVGERHPNFSTGLSNLALLLQDKGEYEEAEQLFRRAIKIDRATIGDEHPDTVFRLNNLADLLGSSGRLAEAEQLFRQAIEIHSKTLGDRHPDHAILLNNFAHLLEAMDRQREAVSLRRQMHAINLDQLGVAEPQTRHGAEDFARHLREHFPDDPALAELEATFGQEIGRE